MELLIKNANAFINGKFINTDIFVKDGVISSFQRPDNECTEVDFGGAYLVPGFIDIHTHGAVGADVNSAGADDFGKLSRFFTSKGTTSFLASVLTDSKENTMSVLSRISAFMNSEYEGAELLGAHLEGPFLSPEKKGAMPEQYLKEGDSALLEKYLKTGIVKYITVAPEIKGVPELIEMFKGDLPFALGHSAADYETTIMAVKSGAVASTHTFNAMQGIDRTEPYVLGAVLEADIYNELIADGHHVHPSNIRMLYKLKGNKKIIAITDSIEAAGMPDGEYKLGANKVDVANGEAFLSGTKTRAGSVLTMDNAIKNLIKYLDISLEKALPMLTENPADLLGLKKGYIKIGYDADFTVLDKDLNVINTIIKGKSSAF